MSRSQKAVVAGMTAALLCVAGAAGAAGLGAFTRHAPRSHPIAVRPPQPRADRNEPARAVRSLPPLRHLFAPDAVLSFDRPVGAATVAKLRGLDGLRAFTVADSGSVVIGRTRLRVLGVDVAKARRFTPRFTATSAPLWTSVLRGELTVDYSLAGKLKNTLGATLPTFGRGKGPVMVRVGAFATVGLGRAEAIVDHSLSASLGLRPARVLVVSAPHRSDAGLRSDLATLFPHAHLRIVRPPHVNQAVISAYARSVIPAGFLALYRAAASTCRGLPWTVLAAIGTVETGNGANTSTSSKGAMGPMQFLPSTFAAYAVDGDGDGVANIQDPADAIYSAARYLCAWGAGLGGQSLYAAIFAYNHADWYVREVIRLAIAYS
jgi:hypothetical protein